MAPQRSAQLDGKARVGRISPKQGRKAIRIVLTSSVVYFGVGLALRFLISGPAGAAAAAGGAELSKAMQILPSSSESRLASWSPPACLGQCCPRPSAGLASWH
jgi:hypothetical protein